MLGLREKLHRFVAPNGEERAIDCGTGTGPLALALAPLVREVVAVDLVPEMLEQGRRRAREVPNVHFVLGDALALPCESGSFDLAGSSRTLHHLERPDLALAELARVTRGGGRLLVVDQLASADPREAEAHDRIERLRDASHARTLSDSELRALVAKCELELERAEIELEERELGEFLDLAGCVGHERRRVLDYVEELVGCGEKAGIDLRRAGGSYAFTSRIGWFLASKP